MTTIEKRISKLEMHSRNLNSDPEIPLSEHLVKVLNRTHQRFTARGRPVPDSIQALLGRGFEILQLPQETRERLNTWLGICGCS